MSLDGAGVELPAMLDVEGRGYGIGSKQGRWR